MQDNKLEIFRKSLEQANYNVPDSATFAETLSDPGKAREFHKSLITDNYDVPEDFETFSSTLGLKKKEASDYGLPTPEVISQIFQNISKEDVEAQGYNVNPPKEFTTPDLSLKSPEFKGYEAPPLTQIIGQTLANDRIAMHEEEYKKHAETRISDIDKEIAKLPQDNTEMLPAMNFSGGLILPTRPVSEEKARLLKEKDDLKMAITKPGTLTYILGKAYNQSIIGLSDAIINGQKRAPEEWLNKYDASTLTDVTATTLGFLLDMPFFGGMGKVGLKIGEAAAKPFVDRAMVKLVAKKIAAGFPEDVAKALVLKAATKTSQIIAGMASSGVSLGSYGFVKSALEDWVMPELDFDDIRWGQALKRGAKDFLLGTGVGGLGIASSAIASKASAIPNVAARLGTKVGVATGGLTAESALFAYGGALLDGRKLSNVTGKEFLETAAMLAMLKISKIPKETLDIALEPKKAAVRLYQSLRFKKPGEGPYAVDIDPWEIEAIGGKDYKTVMDILSKDDNVLGEILKSDKVPALLKQKLLWGSRGVAIEDVDLYSDKVVANGEYIDVYNKEGVLVDKRKAPSKEDATQAAIEIGLQLEDNKMQMKAAAPETEQVKIIGDLKAKGTDIPTVLGALDKPVDERTPEENKIVGEYGKLIPGGDLKPPEPPIEEEAPMEVKKETSPTEKAEGKKKGKLFGMSLRLYNAKEKTPDDITDVIMQHFMRGYTVNRQQFIDETGWSEADIKESGVGKFLEEGGKSFDTFHEDQETTFKHEEKGAMDMGNEIVRVLTSYANARGKINKWTMLEAFEKRHNIEQPFEPTEEEITKQESDEKFAKIIRENGGLNEKAMEQAAEAGLISKEELDIFKSELENENISREQSEREIADEEERIAAESRDQGGSKTVPPGEEPGEGKEKPTEVKAEIEKLKTTPVYHGTFADFGEFDVTKLGASTGAPSAKEGFFFASNRKVAESYASDMVLKIKGLQEYADRARKDLKELTGDDVLQAGTKLFRNEYDKETAKKVGKLLDKVNAYEDYVAGITELPMAYSSKLARSGKIKETFLDIKNPFVKDYKGADIRDESYAEVIKKAKAEGYDSVIFKNTYDGGDPVGGLEPTDVYVVFDKSQIRAETKTNEEPNKPNPPISKGEENIVPGSTEGNEKPVTPKGEAKPVRTTDVVKQKQIDAIDKEYDQAIAKKQKELKSIPKKIQDAIDEANKRVGLFGDQKPIEADEIIKREEQGFTLEGAVERISRPFLQRKAELEKDIKESNTKRENAINIVLYPTLGFAAASEGEPTLESINERAIKFGITNRIEGKDIPTKVLRWPEDFPDDVKRIKKEFGAEAWEKLKADAFKIRQEQLGNAPEANKPETGKGYQYKMDLRPFDIGTYPKEGFVKAENDPEGGFQILTYNRKLTPKELSHWSFTPLTEIAELKGKEFIDKDGEFRVTLNWMKNNKGADVSMFDKEGILAEKPFFMGTTEIMKNIESGYWKELPKKVNIKPEAPKKIVVTKEGVKYGDKTYTDIVDVLDDIANGTVKKEDGQLLREAVNKWDEKNKPETFADSKTVKQNKRYKNEPKTDKPEELAWDEPLPLSPAEDPNFKMSDLNNAMSIRNIARSFVKNMGKIEGMDVRTGFITRFARKARGLFNPDSGIIRVNNIRDLRALTHEFGHLLDYEIFDIRGIISAKAADKQLGTGVDFNGEIYSNVKQVEEAMKSHNITIDEGNFLLEKVKSFEKKKLGEKYSEIVEQGSVVPVKYKGKKYKSDKEINNALANGKINAARASKLIVDLNTLNKGRAAKLDKLRAKYGDDVVAGVLQRVELKKEFDQILRDIGYPSKKRTEGIAEFVYNYVIDPKQLINSTPTALAWFEKMLDNAPEIKDALHTLREDFAKYDAQDVLTKGVAEITPPEPEKHSWLDTIVTLGKDPIYSVVNMLRPMEVMVKKWKTMMDNNTLAYKDPWVSAKQLLGQGGRSEQWIIYHPYFNRGNEVIIRKDIKGLMPIIKPLFGTTDYKPYQAYLVALDAIESHNRGKPQQAYFDRENAQAIRATAEKRFGAAKLMEFQSDIQKYNEALLDFAAESGIISKETARYWKQEHQNYVPLRRIAETYEVFGGKRKTITRELLPEAERVIFSRKGSEKPLKDIFESMIENTNHILASSERNLLNRNIADMFTDIHNYNKSHKIGGAVIEEIDARGMEAYQDPTTGEIRYAIAKVRPKNFRPPKGRILVVREEGNPRFYDVAPEYYDDIFRVTNIVAKQVSGVMRILSAPSHWLQAGAVVYDPTFPVRNIVRDQTSTWFTSKYGYLPTDFLRGIMSAVKKDDIFQKWLASGGDQSFLISADQAMSQNYFDKKVGKFARRKFDAYRHNFLLAFQDFSKASEIGTRLGAFKNAYKRTGNVKLAAIESRDITADYGIHGAMTKQLFQLYPFLNARIQWARTITNSMKNPASFMLKGMALTIPAALNWLRNNQDEESMRLYQSLPTWRRVGLFNVRIPGTDHFLPLPKGLYGVLFASSIESLLDSAVKDDPRVLEELPKQLFKEISPISNWPEVIPFLARPQIEMWANKKGYTGKPIVSESMKLLKPSEQYYNSTPEIIKKMGEALNWSPVKIEHYFKSFTGGAGIGAVNILDETLQAIGLVEKKPEDTFTMLSRMPVLKALLTERPVGLYSGYVSDFYETLDKIEKVNVTFNNFVKTENLDALDKFMADPENKRMYSFYEGNSTALNSFRSALTFARDSMYAVMKDDLLTTIEKQREVRKINDVIQESVLKFKEAYEQNKFFDYGKEMSDIVTKMKEEKKDYRNELAQQQNSYNPYWMQLRQQNKDVYDRLREFGGLRDIEQTRTLTREGNPLVLELEDVRRFNEILVKRYGENVKNMIGTDKSLYETYRKTTNPMDVEENQLQQLLDSAWAQALDITKNDFEPQYSIKAQ